MKILETNETGPLCLVFPQARNVMLLGLSPPIRLWGILPLSAWPIDCIRLEGQRGEPGWVSG